MKRMTILSFLLFPFFLLAQQIEKSYYYFNKEIQLDLDLTALSVVYEDDQSQTLQDMNNTVSKILDNNVSAFKKISANPRYKVELNNAITEEQMVNYLSLLNQLDNVRMAAPVLKYENIRQVVTNEFIVRFKKKYITSADICLK